MNIAEQGHTPPRKFVQFGHYMTFFSGVTLVPNKLS